MGNTNTKKQDKKQDKKKDVEIQVKIVHPNFKDTHTKKVYELGAVIDITEARLKEIQKVEADKKVKLVEVIAKAENVDEETPEDGEVNKENEGENDAE